MITRTPEQIANFHEHMKPSRTCPKCGHELLVRHGSYGDFIGCSSYPNCRFTCNLDGSKTSYKKEVVDWDENGKPTSTAYLPVAKEKPSVCPLNKCDGSGKVPFVKEGKVIPNAFIFCGCSPYSRPYEDEHFRETRPEDIDFPVSYSYYRGLCRLHGWADPGDDQPEPKLEQVKPVSKPQGAPRNDQVEHLNASVNYLLNKVKGLEAKKKNNGEAF